MSLSSERVLDAVLRGRESYSRGRPSTDNLLVLTNFDLLLLISKTIFTFFPKTSYLN